MLNEEIQAHTIAERIHKNIMPYGISILVLLIGGALIARMLLVVQEEEFQEFVASIEIAKPKDFMGFADSIETSLPFIIGAGLVILAIAVRPVRKAVGLLLIILGIFGCFTIIGLLFGIVSIFIGGIFLFS